MKFTLLRHLRASVVVVFTMTLLACDISQNSEHREPVAYNLSDACHVCGMLVQEIAGPKGQVYDNRSKQVKKFCSTSEMLFWYLQPENKSNVTSIFVHDMTNNAWDRPDDRQMIPAREAFYVVGSNKKAAMGKTIVTFRTSIAAAKFLEEFGGEMITFNGLTLELLANQNLN